MDGEEGERHPQRGAMIAKNLLDTWKNLYSPKPMSWKYHDLCLYHSRHYARSHNVEPSKLCWADKLCYKYDPVWFYTLRAKLSGEIKEYRALPQSQNFKGTDSEWYRKQRKLYIKLALSQKADTIPYQDVKN
jgi:hypothetical protein